MYQGLWSYGPAVPNDGSNINTQYTTWPKKGYNDNVLNY